MVVRDRVGRRRYIVVKYSPEIKSLIEKMREVDPKVKIIVRINGFAILFCRHWYKGKIIEILRRNGIKTYRTTGTIKKAKKMISTLQCGGGG